MAKNDVSSAPVFNEEHERICGRCQRELPVSEFYKSTPYRCKDCHRKAMRSTPEAKARQSENSKRWRERHPEKFATIQERESAKRRAATRLAKMHPEEFEKLVVEELRKPKRKGNS